jgi:hypothetical protein
LGNLDAPNKYPRGALALSAAAVRFPIQIFASIVYHLNGQVARALTLWSTGVVTLQMVKDSKRTKVIKEESGGSIKINRTIALPKVMVCEDGRRLSTAFNDASWGKLTRKYMRWVQDMRVTSVEKVIQKAIALVPASRGGESMSTLAVDDSEVVTMVVDISDSDHECKLMKLSLCICSFPSVEIGAATSRFRDALSIHAYSVFSRHVWFPP